MIDFEQYYPTPPDTARKLFHMVDKRVVANGLNILEPSAGTGELIKAWGEQFFYSRHGYFNKDNEIEFNGHCIEINKTRAAALKGKGYKVVWDDFLTFNPLMQYTLIIMNPPFREGAKHLLKAMEICAPGGQIACILNAETIRNPYTNERKALIAKLEEQEDCKVEYATQAFMDADRKTDVEVALVYVKMKEQPDVCVTFENFELALPPTR